jgi:hypothetical protein
MKKLLSSIILSLLACFCISASSQAANTATDLGTIRASFDGKPYDVRVFLVSYDTTGQDLTVLAATDSNTSVCEAGMFFSNTAAMDFTFTPKTSNTITLNLGANQGVYNKMTRGVGLCTVPGYSWKVKSTAAFSALIYFIQGTRLNF